jgi:adenylate cyclase
MRERTEAAQGRVIKTIGDEVMSSFPTRDAAADAAIQMQEAINELKPVGNTKIGIRIGFNFGSIVVQADGDIFGDAVNVASRLSHVAVKGQIITARDTVMNMAPMLKSATRKITAIQIKGKAAEVEVYELMWQQSEDATTMAAARSVYKPKKATLKLVLQGKEHLLSDELTAVSMGRDASADLVIKDRMASRSHGKIERRPGQVRADRPQRQRHLRHGGRGQGGGPAARGVHAAGQGLDRLRPIEDDRHRHPRVLLRVNPRRTLAAVVLACAAVTGPGRHARIRPRRRRPTRSGRATGCSRSAARCAIRAPRASKSPSRSSRPTRTHLRAATSMRCGRGRF